MTLDKRTIHVFPFSVLKQHKHWWYLFSPSLLSCYMLLPAASPELFRWTLSVADLLGSVKHALLTNDITHKKEPWKKWLISFLKTFTMKNVFMQRVDLGLVYGWRSANLNIWQSLISEGLFDTANLLRGQSLQGLVLRAQSCHCDAFKP